MERKRPQLGAGVRDRGSQTLCYFMPWLSKISISKSGSGKMVQTVLKEQAGHSQYSQILIKLFSSMESPLHVLASLCLFILIQCSNLQHFSIVVSIDRNIFVKLFQISFWCLSYTFNSLPPKEKKSNDNVVTCHVWDRSTQRKEILIQK